jgi:CubicO group peptidase (beta-lactamase class C family)
MVDVNWPVKKVKPEEAGMNAGRLTRVTKVMEDFINRGEIAGAITAVVRRGGMPYLECRGKMNLETGQAMREDALFRIYSMTKIITSAAILMLMEDGKFMLREPVKKWIPAFADLKVAGTGADGKEELLRLKRDITIHDLLTHTSGLSYDLVQTARTEGWTLERFVDELCKKPLKRQPGEMWDYSAATDVLGRLVEVVSGKPFDAFLQERIFAPLGMTDTDFHAPPEKVARFAEVYRPNDQGKLEPTGDLGGQQFLTKGFCSGGGGLVSSTNDYLRFALMLLNKGEFQGKKLLSRKTVELMAEDALPPGNGVLEINGAGFGLGVSVVKRPADTKHLASTGEFGWGGAACTQVWIDPAENMVTLFMTQLRPKDKTWLMDLVKNAVYQAID